MSPKQLFWTQIDLYGLFNTPFSYLKLFLSPIVGPPLETSLNTCEIEDKLKWRRELDNCMPSLLKTLKINEVAKDEQTKECCRKESAT